MKLSFSLLIRVKQVHEWLNTINGYHLRRNTTINEQCRLMITIRFCDIATCVDRQSIVKIITVGKKHTTCRNIHPKQPSKTQGLYVSSGTNIDIDKMKAWFRKWHKIPPTPALHCTIFIHHFFRSVSTTSSIHRTEVIALALPCHSYLIIIDYTLYNIPTDTTERTDSIYRTYPPIEGWHPTNSLTIRSSIPSDILLLLLLAVLSLVVPRIQASPLWWKPWIRGVCVPRPLLLKRIIIIIIIIASILAPPTTQSQSQS